MKKLLFTILLLFPFVVSASSMYQEIDILENGDIKVKESITIEGEYNGFKLTLGYKYFDENRIYSADSLEVIKVCESSKTNPLTNIGECFQKVSYAEKGDSLKYTHDVGTSMDTFMFYNPSYRGKSFYIEYILKNVIVGHNDINELRLNMLDSSFNESLDLINIKVNLPKKATDLRAWAHGPLWGNIKLDDNKEYVLFTIDEYDAYTKIDIRMTFDKELVSTTKVTNVDKLNSIIEEETKRADEANKEREEAIKQEEELKKQREALLKRKNTSLGILSSIWLVIAGILLANFRKNHDKEHKSDFNHKYYREFPSNHSPEVIEYLMNKKVTSVGFSAAILNIIYKKGLTVEKIRREKGLIFKKEIDDYVLTSNDSNLKEELTESDKHLRKFLLVSYGDGNSFNLSALETVNDSESKAREFLHEFNHLKQEAEICARKEKFYEDTSAKKTSLILFAIIPFIMVFMYIEYNPLVIILAFISIAFIIYVASSSKRSKNGNELYLKWNALKNFMNDFGSFKEKELPEIALWEKYLVYAHVFGLAEKLRKEMEVKVPNIENYSHGMSSYDYMVFNNALNRSVTSSVNAAITSANAKIAESTASSGSGSGGGFSGGSSGGGFSGGGGSGGGRF